MTQDFVSKFGAVTMGNVSTNADFELSTFEAQINFLFPESLRKILVFLGGAIVFEKRVKFKPKQKTMLEGEDGYHGLELLYGVAKDGNGLREKNLVFQEQLPSGLVAFGESAGGNLVCLEKSTERVMYWHHEAEFNEKSVFEISENFDSFLNALVADDVPPTQRKTQAIIPGKSFLDF